MAKQADVYTLTGTYPRRNTKTMDIQKAASTVTATAVLGTGAFVGGNHQIDKMQGGPLKRQVAKIEAIRQVVREEIYLQLVNNWPKSSGPVKGITVPKQNYREEVPQK